MAHAFLILPNLNDDELLCPFAIVVGPKGRELIDFEADTQEHAVSAAKSYLAAPESGIEMVAFAQDGRTLTTDLEYVDAITVSVRETITNYESTFSQLYRCSTTQLDFIGQVEFMLGREAELAQSVDVYRKFVVVGMESHPTAGGDMTARRNHALPAPQLLEAPERLQ